MVAIATKSGVDKNGISVDFGCWATNIACLVFTSISLIQNIAKTLFGTIGKIKGPLIYCFRFGIIYNSWLLSQKCRQRERTSLRDGLRLPSNITLKIRRHQLLYAMKPEGSLYMCIKFQSKVPTQ